MLSLADEQGQALAEYALIIVSVGIVVVVGLALLGTDLARLYQDIVSTLTDLFRA